ncbi:AMP-binding protein [Synechococcales cyanobacterium C]|uniref:AMP-binding protein n=1 Tax=Petrachloros mirabilis ULC683 TaxID=2781853 RepID=A0A8K2A0H6_9CYAN|nr:AMP-binding protein [Petrachloros mirabilis]NCJ08223.1 AMP-binding protein [Petrachloros mirabilis ULC683]
MADHTPSQMDYTDLESLSQVWPRVASQFGQTVALRDPHSDPEVSLTFAELHQQLQRFAAGLQTLGVQPGDRVALFADNSPRWFIADQGSILAGAVDVVRSSQADGEELAYILENSNSTVLLAENLATLKKLTPYLDQLPIQVVGLLSDETSDLSISQPVLNFGQIFTEGAHSTVKAVPLGLDTLATLLYTSGTTGRPKGVMLSHGNLMHQLNTLDKVIQPQPGDVTLSILPTWHSFGRIAEYFMLSRGCTQVYSNIRHIKRDLQTYKPAYMASVPRLWESLYETIQRQFREQSATKQKLIRFFFRLSQRYIKARRIVQGLDIETLHPSGLQHLLAQLQTWLLAPLHSLGNKMVYGKIREALGGQFRQSVSGGGSLAMHIENFYEIVGIDLLVGYGLTETSPVLSARRPQRNLRRSAGQPIPQTEIRIVDPQTRQTLAAEQKGLVLARGPQVMQGYYQNPEATAKAIDPEGWFDTGDLGWLTQQQDLILTGRAKDTIVLSNGENIEPQPLEDACARSPYIDQIVVVGQDQRFLGALIVPNFDALAAWAQSQNATLDVPSITEKATGETWTLDSPAVQALYRKELAREVQNRPSYRPDDRIGAFAFVSEPFSIDNGLLTQTLKIRRPVVMDRYRDMIDRMFF